METPINNVVGQSTYSGPLTCNIRDVISDESSIGTDNMPRLVNKCSFDFLVWSIFLITALTKMKRKNNDTGTGGKWDEGLDS